MRKKTIIPGILFLLIINQNIFSQKPESVLFTVGDEAVTVDEFLYIYEKNNKNDENFYTPESIKEYLNLFINFKLKVKEAREQGIDTTRAFREEFESYRKQLTKPYMTDKSTLEALKKEAYDRMKWEVRASHILIRLAEDASSEEVQEAEKRINEIYKRAKKGEDFAQLALETSEDPSVKYNKGDLGYFSAFHLIYDFENVAYQTPVGEISRPFRSPFGYHILKVTDKRPYQGQITVKQIYVSVPPEADSLEKAQAKIKIDSIYSLLKQGANFNDLVEKFSDDQRSKVRGGELPPFTNFSYSIPENFKKAAFALKKDGDFSPPVQTSIGWHILQRVKLTGLQPYEELEKQLESKIKNDSRYRLTEENMLNKLKKEYRFKEKTKNLNAIYNYIDSSLLKKSWKAPENINPDLKLFQIEKQQYKLSDFARFMEERHKKEVYKNFDFAIHQYYKEFVKQSLIDYADQHLEEKYPDFRHLVNEYREGMMLFDITDREVWSKAMEDTVGQKAFYEAHKDQYMWKNRVDAVIFICQNEEVANKVEVLLKEGKNEEEIAQELNKENPLNISYTLGKFEEGENKILEPYFGKTGIFKVKPEKNSTTWRVLHLKQYYPPQPKKLEEIRGIVIADYQNELEKNWIEKLKKKYPVKINEEVLNALLKK